MQTNLVGPAGDRVGLDERVFGESLKRPVRGGGLPALSRRDDGHSLAVLGIAGNRGLDPAGGSWRATLDQRPVSLLNLPILELALQGVVGGIVLGQQDQAGGVLVEAVHDPWTDLAADPNDVG